MRKTEYLDLLRYYLDRFPKSMVDDIIRDYEEHFAIGIENGKSEDEISNELGAPFYVAQEYISGDFDRIHREDTRSTGVAEPEGFFDEAAGTGREEPSYYASEEGENESRFDFSDVIHGFIYRIREEWNAGQKGKWILLALMALFLLRMIPALLNFVLTFMTILLVIPLAMILAPFFGGIAAIVGGATLLAHMITGFPAIALHPVTSILFGLGFIGLGILLILLSVHVGRFLRDQYMKIIYRIRWEWSKRRES